MYSDLKYFHWFGLAVDYCNAHSIDVSGCVFSERVCLEDQQCFDGNEYNPFLRT